MCSFEQTSGHNNIIRECACVCKLSAWFHWICKRLRSWDNVGWPMTVHLVSSQFGKKTSRISTVIEWFYAVRGLKFKVNYAAGRATKQFLFFLSHNLPHFYLSPENYLPLRLWTLFQFKFSNFFWHLFRNKFSQCWMANVWSDEIAFAQTVAIISIRIILELQQFHLFVLFCVLSFWTHVIQYLTQTHAYTCIMHTLLSYLGKT